MASARLPSLGLLKRSWPVASFKISHNQFSMVRYCLSGETTKTEMGVAMNDRPWDEVNYRDDEQKDGVARPLLENWGSLQFSRASIVAPVGPLAL